MASCYDRDVFRKMTTYTAGMVEKLEEEWESVHTTLDALQVRCVMEGESADHEGAKEHLLHGAGRRVGVLKRSFERIFTIFPPATVRPLVRNDLSDVQIHLHAFVMNLSGIFDNWAWAFVHRHGLASAVGGNLNVSLFKAATQKYLPEALRGHLSAADIVQWHGHYLKSYRDALAHRIPLYIPPASFTAAEGERYNALNAEQLQCIKSGDFDRVNQIREEQAMLGIPCKAFLHSFSEEDTPKPVLLHPQVLCDAKAVVEFGNLYFDHWQGRTYP